jgi:hypothetical protein
MIVQEILVGYYENLLKHKQAFWFRVVFSFCEIIFSINVENLPNDSVAMFW